MEVRAIIDIQPQTEITGVEIFSKIINLKHFQTETLLLNRKWICPIIF